MLKAILDRHVLLILMGVFAVLGIVSKCIAGITLKRLVRAAGSMNKSAHPLIRLVRAKYEHACMLNDKVQNVGVFVDKYLYEYKILGLRLYRWRRMENVMAGLCLITGAAAAFLTYSVYGMSDAVLKMGAGGAALAILLYLFHLTSDENYMLEAVKTYMVDYLENVFLLDGSPEDANYEAGDTLIGCYHMMKGMEFDGVIAVWPECALTDDERRRLYTTCSRALHAVTLLAGEKLISELGLVL